MKVLRNKYGNIGEQAVDSYTLINGVGTEIECITYGCIITKIMTPDLNGNIENIVLGYENLQDYQDDPFYFGSIVGRIAGRIGGASLNLEGKTYNLEKNEGNNHIHGGSNGFGKLVWKASALQSEDEIGVQFTYHSPDGDQGYPGNIEMKVIYTLNNDNEFAIHYLAETDKTTVMNVTNHSYFNLSGNAKRDILNHSLKMKSDRYLELNSELLPTGEIIGVENTPFDFQRGNLIKNGVSSHYPQNILVGNGYDHPFILNAHHDNEIVLHDPENGRSLTVETDCESVVVYTGNSLSSATKAKGVSIRKYLGVCIETQGFPDAINHAHFPSWILKAGETYSSKTKYTFGLIHSKS